MSARFAFPGEHDPEKCEAVFRKDRAQKTLMRSGDHQHVEHDDRRQRQDHRPDADGPHDVAGGKALLRDGIIAFEVHDAPPRLLWLLPV